MTAIALLLLEISKMSNKFLKRPHPHIDCLHKSFDVFPSEWLLSGKFDSLSAYCEWFDITEVSLSNEFRSCQCDYCKSLPSYDFEAEHLADLISYSW